jgi:flagellar protein FliS
MRHISALYSPIGLSSEMVTASPHRTVQFMIEKCSHYIDVARSSTVCEGYIQKSQSLTKALNIIEYLRCYLHDKEDTKIFTQQLSELYIYIQKILLDTNINDLEPLENAISTLAIVKNEWDKISWK